MGNLKSINEELIYFIYTLEKVFDTLFDEFSTNQEISGAYLTEMRKR